MSSKLKERWVAIDGSVYTERADHKLKIEQGSAGSKTLLVRKSICFNVGQAVAEHIVHLHNMELLRETARKIDLNLVSRAEVAAEVNLNPAI